MNLKHLSRHMSETDKAIHDAKDIITRITKENIDREYLNASFQDT